MYQILFRNTRGLISGSMTHNDKKTISAHCIDMKNNPLYSSMTFWVHSWEGWIDSYSYPFKPNTWYRLLINNEVVIVKFLLGHFICKDGYINPCNIRFYQEI